MMAYSDISVVEYQDLGLVIVPHGRQSLNGCLGIEEGAFGAKGHEILFVIHGFSIQKSYPSFMTSLSSFDFSDFSNMKHLSSYRQWWRDVGAKDGFKIGL